MIYKAVITGDIVDSREVEDLGGLLKVLKETMSEIENELKTNIQLEIYRGDSFQMLIEHPEEAIKIAILTRIKLRSKTQITGANDINISIDNLWDTRISIGIGVLNKPALKVVESTGEAFELSGNQLDAMKKSQDRLRIASAWPGLTHQFKVLAKLGDAILSRWTRSSCEAAYRHLLFGETQKQIAQKLKISQPAVHKRLSIANIDAIESMINYLNHTIKSQTNGI